MSLSTLQHLAQILLVSNIESFIQPFFEEMAIASEGIWIWDAIHSIAWAMHVS